MRIASIGDTAGHRDDQRRRDIRHGNRRREPARQREAASGEPRHGNNNRKRVTRGVELLKQQMEDEVRREGGHEQERDAPFPEQRHQQADDRRDADRQRERNRMPRQHERLIQADRDVARRGSGPEHVHPGEVFSRLRMERCEIRGDAAARDDERDAPREASNHECRQRFCEPAVLNDHQLVPGCCQLVGDRAGHDVGHASGRERHNDAHHTLWIVGHIGGRSLR